jgi:acyl-coenzyme A synthetase/AMP-(fatty) acid ligase
LDATLANAAQYRLQCELLELFGSTETGVFASRRTATQSSWLPYPGVQLEAVDASTRVAAPWFAEPVLLQDILEPQLDGRFSVRGRNSDMIDVAGKRASVSELTRRVLAIDGVKDAVVFQPDSLGVGRIRRVAALVVAPNLTAQIILERLAASVDPAFLPRPLLLVDALPRNETGKLPKERLMEVLRGVRRDSGFGIRDSAE